MVRLETLIRAVGITALITAITSVSGFAYLRGDFHRMTAVTAGPTDQPINPAEAALAERSAQPRAEPGPAPTPVPAPVGLRLIMPVVGISIAGMHDSFNDSRGVDRLHHALDIMAPRGTPVVAAAAGVVERLHSSEAGGNSAYVRTVDRRAVLYYAHLDRYDPGLREGAILAPGDPIGTVGTTGNSDPGAPHLHLAILVGEPQDPWYHLRNPANPFPLLMQAR